MIKQNNIPTVKLLHGLIEENKISEFENLSEIWVFGYGSLVWLPKFEYTEKVTGYITGYDRRFYQGNSTHRGVPGKPGRVATLLRSESPTARTYGAAYRLVGRDQIHAAMDHLNMRESTLGGYVLEVDQFTTLPSADSSESVSPQMSKIPVVFYVATAENDQFTGHESLEVLALIIATSVGPSGPNRDYLFNLAKWQREALPLVEDDHLYRLEKMTQRVIAAYEKAPTYVPLAPIMVKSKQMSSASSWSPSPIVGRRRNSFIADKATRSRL